jgi:polyisoprenoid-binding protein YceI
MDQVHSDITFKVRHLMISNVKGVFKTFDASIYTVGKDFLTAEIDLWIDAASIDTGDNKRDEHLKSAEFFDVENHKQITFISNTIEKIADSKMFEVWGELTIKAITKNIRLTVEFGGIVTDLWGKEKAGFSVTGKINRTDFELVWNNALAAGGVVVGEEVSIACELELYNMGEKEFTMEVEHKVEDTIVF